MGDILNKLTTTLIILGGAIVLLSSAQKLVELFLKNIKDAGHTENQRQQRIKTLTNIVKSVISVGLWTIAALMTMSTWNLDIRPILTGAGILGLAVGFGSQKLVQDVVTGFFLLLENTYNLGDRIEIAGVTGKVHEINVRTTIVVDDEGNTHTIPNSQITRVKKYKK